MPPNRPVFAFAERLAAIAKERIHGEFSDEVERRRFLLPLDRRRYRWSTRRRTTFFFDSPSNVAKRAKRKSEGAVGK